MIEVFHSSVAPRIALPKIPQEWLDILAILAVQPRTVLEIQRELNLVQPTASHRLKRMCDAKLIEYVESRDGSRVMHIYRIIPDGINAMVADIRNAADQIESWYKQKPQRKRRRQNA